MNGVQGGTQHVFAAAFNGSTNLIVAGDFWQVDGGNIPAGSIASWDGNEQTFRRFKLNL